MRRLLAAIGLTLIFTSGEATSAERPAPERWRETIERFEAADATKAPPNNGILFVGSSSIRMWKLEKSFPDRPVINRGFGGSHIADATFYVQQLVTKHQPRVVVLYAGDNDIARGLTPAQVEADYREFVGAVRKQLPKTKIVFIAIKPSIKRWALVDKMRAANAAIRQITEADPLQSFVDIDTPMIGDDGLPMKSLFVEDGLHLSEQGYRLWADLVRPQL